MMIQANSISLSLFPIRHSTGRKPAYTYRVLVSIFQYRAAHVHTQLQTSGRYAHVSLRVPMSVAVTTIRIHDANIRLRRRDLVPMRPRRG